MSYHNNSSRIPNLSVFQIIVTDFQLLFLSWMLSLFCWTIDEFGVPTIASVFSVDVPVSELVEYLCCKRRNVDYILLYCFWLSLIYCLPLAGLDTLIANVDLYIAFLGVQSELSGIAIQTLRLYEEYLESYHGKTKWGNSLFCICPSQCCCICFDLFLIRCSRLLAFKIRWLNFCKVINQCFWFQWIAFWNWWKSCLGYFILCKPKLSVKIHSLLGILFGNCFIEKFNYTFNFKTKLAINMQNRILLRSYMGSFLGYKNHENNKNKILGNIHNKQVRRSLFQENWKLLIKN